MRRRLRRVSTLRRVPGLLLVLFVSGILGPFAALAADVDELRKTGARHYKARRYFQAIEAFEAALAEVERRGGAQEEERQISGDLARALGGLGFEYLNESETRLAEETFRSALAKADDYFANFGLGYLYFMRKEDGEARTHLLASLRLLDTYSPTHKLLAVLSYRKGQTKVALERMERARELDSKDEEAKYLVEQWKRELQILDKFSVSKTAHFLLRVDPQVPDALRVRVEDELERAYVRIGEAFGSWPKERTAVVLFAEGSFHRATGTEHWVGGLYDGQLKLPLRPDVLEDPKRLRELVEVIRHEYSHAVVRGLAPECPVWFNEGLAQYLEGKGRVQAIYARLRAGREARIPLRKMPARLSNIEEVELARWVYLQGLGFVEFLAERYKPFRLRLFLRALAEEHSASRAFERTYGATLEELEKEWWDTIESAGDAPAQGADGED